MMALFKHRVSLRVMVICVASVAGCKNTFQSQEYSYQYSINGCDTLPHTFSSREQLCEGLRDEALNRGCAEASRAERYQKECGGSMVTTSATGDEEPQDARTN